MAQQELMLRLIKDGKIVGYHELKRNMGLIFQWEYDSDMRNMESWAGSLDYDSFELGIKIENDWWFEGDLIVSKPISGELYFDGNTYCWGYMSHQHGDFEPLYIWDKNEMKQWKRFGNIHEEGDKNDIMESTRKTDAGE